MDCYGSLGIVLISRRTLSRSSRTRQARGACSSRPCFSARSQRSQPRPSEATMPKMTTLAHAMQSTHTVTTLGRSLHCLKCHQRSPSGIGAAKTWIATMCKPDRILHATYTAGTVRPTRIPRDQVIQVGHRKVHHTTFVSCWTCMASLSPIWTRASQFESSPSSSTTILTALRKL